MESEAEVEVVQYVVQNLCEDYWQDEDPIEAFDTLDEAVSKAMHYAKQCMHLQHRVVQRRTKRVIRQIQDDEELITFQPLEGI